MKFNDADLSSYKKLQNKIWNDAKFFSINAEKYNTIYTSIDIDDDNLQEIQLEFIEYMNNYKFLEAGRFINNKFLDWFCSYWIENNKSTIQNGDINKLLQGMNILEQFLAMLNNFMPYICYDIKTKLLT